MVLRYPGTVRYLVRARVKAGRHAPLRNAIENETLGRGSVAEGEYLRNMREARIDAAGDVRWVEVCYCPTPLQEERPYWEEFFTLTRVQDAHDRRRCRDANGSEPWACDTCGCTLRLECKLAGRGEPFLEELRSTAEMEQTAKWKTRLVEGAFPDRAFDIEFWQEQGDEAIFRAAWEMVELAEEVKYGRKP